MYDINIIQDKSSKKPGVSQNEQGQQAEMNSDITENKIHIYHKSQLKQADTITTKREKKRDKYAHEAQMNGNKKGHNTHVRLQPWQVPRDGMMLTWRNDTR